MVQSFLKGLVFVHNGNVTDLVQLVKALDSVFDQLSELDSTLDGVGHALNDDVVSAGGTTCGRDSSFCCVEQLVGTLEVAANANTTLDADLVGWEHLLGFVDAQILFCQDRKSVV